MVLGIVIFESCAESTSKSVGSCLSESLIPLIIPLICVICKVICLRSQRMLLWGGFVLCVIAQIIVLSLVNAQFK